MLREPILYLSLFLKTRRDDYYRLLQEVRQAGTWETWMEFLSVRRCGNRRAGCRDRARSDRHVRCSSADDRRPRPSGIVGAPRPRTDASEPHRHDSDRVGKARRFLSDRQCGAGKSRQDRRRARDHGTAAWADLRLFRLSAPARPRHGSLPADCVNPVSLRGQL